MTFLQSLPLGIQFSGDRKSPVFIFYCFRDLLDLKLIKDFFTVLLFYHENQLESLKQMRGATRPKRAWVARPTVQAAPPGPVWPLDVVSSPSLYGCLCFDKKGTPYFSHNFLRRRWRRNPSSTSGRADFLLPPDGNHRHHHHQLLLGVWGSISITSSSSPTSAPSPPRDSMSSPS
jgi:hypothetical protein